MFVFQIFSEGTSFGLIWAIMAIGVYITYRILDIADLGVEGTFPLGACLVAFLISIGIPAILATIIATIFGALFGILTGVLHTKLKIPAILSGIITMTALYTINMIILGKFQGTETTLAIDSDMTIFSSTNNFLFKNNDHLFLIVLGFVLLISIAFIGLILFGFVKTIIKNGYKANLKENIIKTILLSILGIIVITVTTILLLWILNVLDLTELNKFLCKYIDILSMCLVSGIILAIVFAICYWFFGTEIGMSLRATGNNKQMAKAQGINTDIMIILGLGISNALVALSGAVYAQDLGNANMDLGTGIIVIGLAAIVVGESIFGRQDFKKSLISVIVGSIIYFILDTTAVKLHVENYLKLVRAALIVFVLVIPQIKKLIKNKKKHVGGLSNA